MADPSDPYLVSLPPVPVLNLRTTLDVKPAGYFERPVVAVVPALNYRGQHGVNGGIGRNGRSGTRQPGENAAPGQHGTPADSGMFIDAHLDGLNPNNPEAGVSIKILNKLEQISFPPANAVEDGVAVISVRGGDGGDGGDGGVGGHGDMGQGDGGRGGAGGAAGHGGFCRVTTHNPYLLMMLRIDLRPGIPGAGGGGGSGGSFLGAGPRGPTGEMGGAEYAILSPDGGVLEESVTPYHLQLLTYDIIDDMNDNILEPGEWVTISNVQLMNAGGLTLPHGSKFQFCNTDSVTFDPHDITLSAMPSGTAVTIPTTFRAKITDVPEAASPGQFHGEARYPSSAFLLNRQFQQGCIWSKMHTQYPIIISKMGYPQQIGRGDRAELKAGIKNISTRMYGAGPDTHIVIRIHTHPLIIPAVDGRQQGPDGGHFVDFIIADVPPGGESIITMPVDLAITGPEYFERLPWRMEVLLRGKRIELDAAMIRVAPKWDEFADVKGDLVIFTGHHWSRNEYLLWMKLCNVWLCTQPQIWDFDYYRGISFDMATKKRHPLTWTTEMLRNEGREPHKRSMVFSISKPDQLQSLSTDDLYKHFMTFPLLRDLTVGPSSDEHGALIFGIDDNTLREQLFWSGMDIDLTPHFKDTFTFTTPNEKDAKGKAQSLLKKLNSTEFLHKISLLKIATSKDGRLYRFGELRAKRIAFRNNSRLYTIPQPVRSFIDQKGIPDEIIDLNCHMGALFCQMIATLPFAARFNMVMKSPVFEKNYKVVVRSGEKPVDINALDMMMVICYQDVRIDYTYKDKQRPKLEALTVLIENNVETYRHPRVLTIVLYMFMRAHKKASIGDKSAEKRKDRVKMAVWGKNYKKDPNYVDYTKFAEKAMDLHKKINIGTFLDNGNGTILFDAKE